MFTRCHYVLSDRLDDPRWDVHLYHDCDGGLAEQAPRLERFCAALREGRISTRAETAAGWLFLMEQAEEFTRKWCMHKMFPQIFAPPTPLGADGLPSAQKRHGERLDDLFDDGTEVSTDATGKPLLPKSFRGAGGGFSLCPPVWHHRATGMTRQDDLAFVYLVNTGTAHWTYGIGWQDWVQWRRRIAKTPAAQPWFSSTARYDWQKCDSEKVGPESLVATDDYLLPAAGLAGHESAPPAR